MPGWPLRGLPVSSRGSALHVGPGTDGDGHGWLFNRLVSAQMGRGGAGFCGAPPTVKGGAAVLLEEQAGGLG